jgi:hypothetical protein
LNDNERDELKDDHVHGDHNYAPRHSAQRVILSTLAAMQFRYFRASKEADADRSQGCHGKGSTGERPLNQADDWIDIDGLS